MKKKISIVLCLIIALSGFAACGKDDGPQKPVPPKPPVNTPDAQKPEPQKPSDMMEEGENAVSKLWDGMKDIFEDPDSGVKIVEDKGDIFDKEYKLDKSIFESYTLRTSESPDKPAEIFIAKVKEGKMAEAEEALEKRRTYLAEKWGGTADYAKEPLILKNGDYIMLLLHGNYEKARAEFEKLAK